MIALGKKQELTVAKVVDFGVYLGEKETAGEKDTVLLPGKQVPEGTKKGDKLSVFRRDSSASGSPGEQNRCIFGLGIGKGFVSSI